MPSRGVLHLGLSALLFLAVVVALSTNVYTVHVDVTTAGTTTKTERGVQTPQTAARLC